MLHCYNSCDYYNYCNCASYTCATRGDAMCSETRQDYEGARNTFCMVVITRCVSNRIPMRVSKNTRTDRSL